MPAVKERNDSMSLTVQLRGELKVIDMRRRYIFILIAALSSLAGFVSGQTVTPDLVFVNAIVTGPKKVSVAGLKAENFQVLEDGAVQKITAFSPPDGIWDIHLLLANSALSPGRADRTSAAIRDAVATFQKAGNPGDRIKVDELNLGATDLYGAIDRNLVDLQKSTNPRRALIVITDGFNNQFGATAGVSVSNAGGSASTDSANRLVDYSKQLNIPIYFLYTYAAAAGGTVPTGQGARATLSTTELSEKDVLTTVATQTGGEFYSVDVLSQLESQCELLAEELRNEYVLGFKSTNDKKDGKWRKLKVTVKAPSEPKLAVAAKAKYFVPKPIQ
jgi:Ca-activated chloride channel family protein